MQRFITWSTGAIVWAFWIGLSAVWLPAQEPKQPAGDVDVLAAAKQAEAAIRRALDEKTDFAFVETPLQDVVQYFAKKHKIEIQLDTKALDDAGLAPDLSISAKVAGISLRSALRLLLKSYDLTWLIENEVLMITTVDEAGQRLTTEVYEVSDLVVVAGETDFQPLIDTITTVVAPTTWDDVGGPGSVSPLHRLLVINQTDEVHEQIAALLAEIRRVRKQRGDHVAVRPMVQEPGDIAGDPMAVSVKIYKVAVPSTKVVRSSPKVDGKSDKPQDAAANFTTAATAVPNDRFLEELARALPALVRPETWEQAGGTGVVYALPADTNFTGQLLVRQTGEVHVQIQKFLKDLQPEGTIGGLGGGGGGGNFF